MTDKPRDLGNRVIRPGSRKRPSQPAKFPPELIWKSKLRTRSRDFSGGLVVQNLPSVKGMWVPSPGSELRSHMLRDK